MSFEDLQLLLANFELTGEEYVFCTGMPDWVPVTDLLEEDETPAKSARGSSSARGSARGPAPPPPPPPTGAAGGKSPRPPPPPSQVTMAANPLFAAPVGVTALPLTATVPAPVRRTVDCYNNNKNSFLYYQLRLLC